MNPNTPDPHWRKLLAIVFAVALAIRLVDLVVVLPKLKPDVDLDYYRSLGQSLAAGRGFVVERADGRVLPNIARTPLYPLFLAGLIRVGGDRLGLFLAAQCLLGAGICWLTALLARRWLSTSRAAIAGLLLAVDPNSVQRCVDLRTETLFTLLLLGGLFCVVWRRDQAWAWALAGAVWSLATLCRPIGIFLWIAMLAIAIVWRMRPVFVLLFLAAYFPLIGLWTLRNGLLTGHWFFCSQSTRMMIVDRSTGIVAEREGLTLEAAQTKLLNQVGDVEFFENRPQFDATLAAFQNTSRQIIRSAPGLLLKQSLRGSAQLLFGPGARGIEHSMRTPEPPARFWPPLYIGALSAVVALSVLGACKLGRDGFVLALLLLYFVGLAGGSLGSSRYRLPITPLLAILAVAGAQHLRKPTCAKASS